MSALGAGTYPLAGISYLATTPRLLSRVARFLGLTTGVSALAGLAWFRVAWSAHAAFISSIMGVGLLSKAATVVLLFAEAMLPVMLLFGQRLEGLQGKLFDETLKLRGVNVTPLSAADRERMAAFLAKQRTTKKLLPAPPALHLPGPLGALSGIVNTAVRFAYNVVVPRPKEGFLVRKARDVITLPIKALVPLSLPVFALVMDGPAQAASLHQAWLERKGLSSAEEQAAVCQRHRGAYRAFGAVAAGLNYIPVLSWFLSLSNAVGAALWAADVEKKGGALFSGAAASS